MPHFEEAPVTEAEYATAIQVWSDSPDRQGTGRPGPETVVQVGSRFVPLGDLLGRIGARQVAPASMGQGLRDAFDYHGMPLREHAYPSGTRLRTTFPSDLRPSGWEHQFVRDLDTHFDQCPGVWPAQRNIDFDSTPGLRPLAVPGGFYGRMSHLKLLGLSASNWGGMPVLREAFERHGMQVTRDPSGQVRPDESRGLQTVPLSGAAASLNAVEGASQFPAGVAVAGQRRGRDQVESSSSRSSSPGQPPAARQRRR